MQTITPSKRTNDEQEDYSRLVEIRREISHYQNAPASFHPSRGLVFYVCALMDNLIGRENRNKFLTECFHRVINTSKDLTEGEQMGLLLWAAPLKEEGNKWHSSPKFTSDMYLVRRYFGQLEFNQKENQK